MKNTLPYLSLLLFACSLFSCGYRLAIAETVEGKKIIYKAFSPTERGERKKMRSWFRHSRGMEYNRYTGSIRLDSTQGVRFVEYDSVRVYLYRNADDFTSLFTSGVLSGQMFYCAADESCTPFDYSGFVSMDKNGDTILPHLYGYRGYGISINRFRELKDAQLKPTQRRFELCVNNVIGFAGGCIIYLLELTNEQADKDTDRKTFLAGSRVTVLRKVWIEI